MTEFSELESFFWCGIFGPPFLDDPSCFSDAFLRRHSHTALQERQAITSDGPRAPFTWQFSATLAAEWMPGLFPEQSQ
ncbi:hypothetical protein [Magnetofaba australis]|uniref:Uncharacterized protein n=1 Tax=Magnetofaba australis IT-1 TaxID=1434232 RepID=A0A1Y2K9Y9_9PROT|nr:hypothetical protein [Magnetofaba australis]OSM08476.1 hypothetical protein MAIT1_04965 [Magnetofaba australis IT-1]OSM08779.1 hypothetical protein MAIT1_04901 [Magnetofaba australis IT-1]